MYKEMTIGVVVPAYNEVGFVGDVIDTIPDFVDRVYVVDDGSSDGTWEEIIHHAERRNDGHSGRFDSLVVPIQHERNRGVGGAIKTGYQRARKERLDATAVLGGDNQMDSRELSRYLDPIAEEIADYTKGNRFSRPEHWAEMPRFRFFGNVILSYLTKIASGYWGIMDSQNGYCSISRNALERTDIDGMYEYYGYCNDLLVRLNTAGMRVADVPRSSDFAYEDGWKSHIDYKEYIPRVSVMLLQGFGRRLQQKYILADYHPLAPLYGLGIGLASVSSLGFVTALTGYSRDGISTWLQGIVAGFVIFLYATLLDREENRHLEISLTGEPDTQVADNEQQANAMERTEIPGDTDARGSDESVDVTISEA